VLGFIGKEKMKILLADDHELIRKGLIDIISSRNNSWQLAEAASLADVQNHLVLNPETDLVLLDLNLPGSSDLNGLSTLQKHFPGIAVVIISSEEAPEVVVSALRKGASGYIPKSTCNEVLIKALELVVSGGVYVPPQVLHDYSIPVGRPEAQCLESDDKFSFGELSEVQQQIVRLLAEGMSNKEISVKTGLALQTVKNQVSRILRKTGLDSRTALAARMAKNGKWTHL
jgi:Response regulator containing a CheY-like receiver domain and an HTH DNA-binding domain